MESRSHVGRNGYAVVTGEFLGDLVQLSPVVGEMDRLTFLGVNARPDNVPELTAIAVNMEDNGAGQFGEPKLVLETFD